MIPDTGFFFVIFIAVGLSADCFAVALSSSIANRNIGIKPICYTALSFGTFQALMPVLGWLAGTKVVQFIAGYDHWAAFVLLTAVGGRMIWESLHSRESNYRINFTKILTLLTLSIATSIDALAIGLTFAFLKVNIIFAGSVIGIVAFTITMVGFLLGKKMSTFMGKRAEIMGGLILIGIGIKIVLEHIL
jgi:putative Mn2+ efflux pump MntP